MQSTNVCPLLSPFVPFCPLLSPCPLSKKVSKGDRDKRGQKGTKGDKKGQKGTKGDKGGQKGTSILQKY